MRSPAVLALAALFVSASALAADAAKSASPPRPKTPPHASVTILAPTNGAHVGQDVLVKFGVNVVKIGRASCRERV